MGRALDRDVCVEFGKICISAFFFNDTATTEIYTLSLHDALPISCILQRRYGMGRNCNRSNRQNTGDRKSTRLNSSHGSISYAAFCLQKNKTNGSTATSSRPALSSWRLRPTTSPD